VKERYDVIHVVFIHTVGCYGSIEKLGAYASVVRYTKHGVEFEELFENEDFTILDEIVHQHVEESD